MRAQIDPKAHSDNSRFLAEEQTKQQLVMGEQDQALGAVSESLTTLHRIGKEINTELHGQEVLLNKIEEKTDGASTQMSAAMKGLNKLAKDSDKGKLCMILFLSLILIGLGYAVFDG